MKKLFTLLFAAAVVCQSCKKEDADSNQNAFQQPENQEPATEVLSEDGQRTRFKNTANQLLDNVNSNDIQNLRGYFAEIGAIDMSKYDKNGAAAKKLMENVESMMSQSGNLYSCVYNLSQLRGIYTFSGQTQNYTPSGNIVMDIESKWLFQVNFSEDTRTVLINSSSNYTESVQIPTSCSVSVSRYGTEILNIQISFDTNISNSITQPDMQNAKLVSSVVVNAAGHEFNLCQFNLGDGNATCNCFLKNGDKVILSETLSISDICFDQSGEPTGAGNGYFEANVMGLIQARVNISDISALVDYCNKMGDNNKNESTFKSYLKKVNELMNNGIYFSSDIRQCGIELDSHSYNYWNYNYQVYETRWEAVPVFALADGTKYSDPSQFFSSVYFYSVISRFQNLVNGLRY